MSKRRVQQAALQQPRLHSNKCPPLSQWRHRQILLRRTSGSRSTSTLLLKSTMRLKTMDCLLSKSLHRRILQVPILTIHLMKYRKMISFAHPKPTMDLFTMFQLPMNSSRPITNSMESKKSSQVKHSQIKMLQLHSNNIMRQKKDSNNNIVLDKLSL